MIINIKHRILVNEEKRSSHKQPDYIIENL